MKKVTYTGVVGKKPTRETVFIEDTLEIPFHIKHPKNGSTLKRVGKVVDTDEKPLQGSFVIREFTDEELQKLSEKEASTIMRDIDENPENYEGADELKLLPIEHWQSEVKRTYAKLGKLVIL